VAAGDTVRMKDDSIVRALCMDVPSGNAEVCGSQSHPMSLAGQVEERSFCPVQGSHQCNILTKTCPPGSLVELCQRRSGQLDSGPCKQPSSVPFFAMRYLEMHSIKPLLNPAWIQPEAQSTGVPGSFCTLSSTRCSGLS